MEYNKSLLESWTGDSVEEDPEEDPDDGSWDSMWYDIVYCHRVNKRIEYCKSLLAGHKDAFLCYVLARLYSYWDAGYCRQVLDMRPVRYYCIAAIRTDRNYAPAWALLSSVYWRLSVVNRAEAHLFDEDGDFVEEAELFLRKIEKGGHDLNAASCESRRKQIKYIEKAIYCIKRALQKEPLDKKFQGLQTCYFQERNEVYKEGAGDFVGERPEEIL